MDCSTCHRANPADTVFCSQCGTPLSFQAVALEEERAIAYAIRAGDHAVTRFAYEEAVEQYVLALSGLERARADDTRRCTLMLALGNAQYKAGAIQQAKETFRRAADIARDCPAPELFAHAVLGYGGVWSEAGVEDAILVDLLREALSAVGEEDSGLRVRLLGRLAQEWYLRSQGTDLSQQSVETARRLDDTTALLSALHSRHATLWRPDDLTERLTVASEIVHLAERTGSKELALQGHYWKLTDLLELGDLSAVDRELHAYTQLAQLLRQPLYLSRAAFRQAMRALLDGRFVDAERFMQHGLAIGQRAQNQTTDLIFGVQLWTLRWEQGRLSEVEGTLRQVIAHSPLLSAWRCALIYVQSERGRMDETRAMFERTAGNDFADIPRDAFWLISLTLLAEVCVALHDTARAAHLYALLLPYASRHVVVGRAAAAYYGSVARPLGLLATTMQQWDEAVRHFEQALTAHAQVGARPWLAHTQHAYATMLLKRGQAGDCEQARALMTQALGTARELGMTSLVEKTMVLQQGTEDQEIAAHTFRCEGDYWTIRYGGMVLRLKDTKGLQYIAYLLRHPGREFHVLDLVAGVDKQPTRHLPRTMSVERAAAQRLHVSSMSHPGSELDRQTKTAYKRRLDDLRDELEEADRFHDPGRVAAAQAEIDFITRELADAYGMSGHARKRAEAAERARKLVANRIRDGLGKMQKKHPTLWRHLFNSLKTGTFCSYTPEHPVVWNF